MKGDLIIKLKKPKATQLLEWILIAAAGILYCLAFFYDYGTERIFVDVSQKLAEYANEGSETAGELTENQSQGTAGNLAENRGWEAAEYPAEVSQSAEDPAEVSQSAEEARGAKASKVNINSASVTELMQLKGIGEKKARAVVEYRESHGAFSSIEDIMKVPGIKKGVFSKIEEDICV